MRKTFLALLMLAFAALSANDARSAPYNAYDEFASHQGANGVWHYLKFTGSTSTYGELTFHESSHLGSPAWLGTDGDLFWLPAISKDFTEVHHPEYGDMLHMHPGDNHSRHDVVLRWIAPDSGPYAINMSLVAPANRAGAGSDGYDVYLEHNGSPIRDKINVPPADDEIWHHANETVDVVAGDLIDLRINHIDENGHDAAYVDLQIEPIPEPSALALFALGLLGCLRRARRR